MAAFVHLTRVSSNKKTGPIPVSTTSMDSCPVICEFNTENAGGCYANGGPLRLHWQKVSNGERGMAWDDFCQQISKLPKRQLWRHNQAGDLPHSHEYIDENAVTALVQANKGKTGFTYTHHDISKPHNREMVELCNEAGFTINVSGNNPAHAVRLSKETSAPVVSVVADDFWQGKNSRNYDGKAFVRCPAEYQDDVSCATCAACAVSNRKSIIAFTAHGTQKKKAAIIAKG